MCQVFNSIQTSLLTGANFTVARAGRSFEVGEPWRLDAADLLLMVSGIALGAAILFLATSL
jgi:hypothetical protein